MVHAYATDPAPSWARFSHFHHIAPSWPLLAPALLSTRLTQLHVCNSKAFPPVDLGGALSESSLQHIPCCCSALPQGRGRFSFSPYRAVAAPEGLFRFRLPLVAPEIKDGSSLGLDRDEGLDLA